MQQPWYAFVSGLAGLCAGVDGRSRGVDDCNADGGRGAALHHSSRSNVTLSQIADAETRQEAVVLMFPGRAADSHFSLRSSRQ